MNTSLSEENLAEKAYEKYEFKHCLEYIVFWYELSNSTDGDSVNRVFQMTHFYSGMYPVKELLVLMIQEMFGFELDEKNIDILCVVVA